MLLKEYEFLFTPYTISWLFSPSMNINKVLADICKTSFFLWGEGVFFYPLRLALIRPPPAAAREHFAWHRNGLAVIRPTVFLAHGSILGFFTDITQINVI